MSLTKLIYCLKQTKIFFIIRFIVGMIGATNVSAVLGKKNY